MLGNPAPGCFDVLDRQPGPARDDALPTVARVHACQQGRDGKPRACEHCDAPEDVRVLDDERLLGRGHVRLNGDGELGSTGTTTFPFTNTCPSWTSMSIEPNLLSQT